MKSSYTKLNCIVNAVDLIMKLTQTLTPTDRQLLEKFMTDARGSLTPPMTPKDRHPKNKRAVLATVSDPRIQHAICNGKQTMLVKGSAPASPLPFYVYLCRDGFMFARAVVQTVTNTVDPSDRDLAAANMTREEFNEKSNGKSRYFWHLSHIHVYTKPREIMRFAHFPTEPRNWRFMDKVA